MARKREIKEGQRIAGTRLKLLKHDARKVRGSWQGLFVCDCGNKKILPYGSVGLHHTKSCGCLRREAVTTHGRSRTAEYQIWFEMKRRCKDRKDKRYKDYGGRGIKVCKRWEKFANFFSDMGPRPSNKHSLERTNNNKGYSPSNCKWATAKEQNNNKRSNIVINHKGVTRTATEWSKQLGGNPALVSNRLYKGWDEVRAVTVLPRFHSNSVYQGTGGIWTSKRNK